MKNALKEVSKIFLEKINGKNIRVVSHFDTDGITAAAIMSLLLKKLEINFNVKIISQLDKEFIYNLKDKLSDKDILIFLDLGSSHINEIKNLDKDVFILDHHEVSEEKPNHKIHFINPHLFGKEEVSAAGVAYLLAKALQKEDKNMANLAVVGMVGDVLEKEISKLNNEILKDAEIKIQKGLILYPSTRPIHKTLEYSNIFIPGVTGNSLGTYRLLNECGIKKENGTYKNLLELSEEELSKLITAILLRTKISEKEIIGNIYLIKFFNKLNDAREISAIINACSRLGHPEVALSLCLQNENAKKKAEDLYVKYKQEIIKSLYFAQNNMIEGKNYIIINAKNNIKDTIIGTVMSILINSINKNQCTIIVGMAYKGNFIKVSARISENNEEKNAREILNEIVKKIGGECGGHKKAAGCIISKENEEKFIEILKKRLEVEVIKI